MTDTIDAPAAPADASSLPTADAGQMASAREHWVSLGYTAEAFDQAMAGPAVGSEAPSEAQQVEVLGNAHAPMLDATQAQELAASLIAAGMDPDRVNAALAADGFAPPPEDTRTDDQKEFDKAFQVARPEEIKVDYRAAGIHDADPSDLAALNAGATEWASGTGFDPILGAAVVERVVQVSRAFQAMSPAEQGLFKAEQRAIFERQAGTPERAKELMTSAAASLARAGHTEFAQVVREGGAAHDAWTIVTLAHLTDRLAARG